MPHLRRSDTAVLLGLRRLLIGSVLMLACFGSERAHAGTYIMRSCNVPGERPAPSGPWAWVHAPNTYANDECASGGGFGLNAGPMQRVTAAGVKLEQPSKAITISRVRLWMVARLSGSGSWLFVAAASDANGQTSAQDIFGPPGGDTLTAPFVSPVLPKDTGAYLVFLSCSGSTWDGCTPASPNPLEIRGAEVTLQEEVSPTGSLVGGSLLDGGPQSGIRTLGYTLSDQESGVAVVAAAIGNHEVAVHDFASECQHSDFAACPQHRTGSLTVDTRKIPDGIYPLTMRVTDAAGNRETVQASTAILIRNGRVSRPSGPDPTTHARLTAAFVGRRGATVTVPYNRRLVIRGRLTTPVGRPIGNATVEITESPTAGRGRIVRGHAVTRGNGTYRYVIERRSASRTVRIRYIATLRGANLVASARLRVNVAAASTLRVALTGIRVSYGGQVISHPIPPNGKLVYVEGRAIDGGWTRFAQLRTDSRGRFSGRYRLRVRRPGVRLQFRVRIPKERGYPFVGSVSRAITRTVR